MTLTATVPAPAPSPSIQQSGDTDPYFIPPALADAIRGNPRFDPSLRGKLHEERADLWQLYLDLMELDWLKLQKMVDKHAEDEDPDKYALRQQLSCVFNMVPTLVNMIRGYLFSEEPNIDSGGDADIEAFLNDCDGAGTSYVNYVREKVLPLCMVQGHVDVLVQLPRVIGDVRSVREAQDAGIRPTCFAFTLTKTLSYSAQQNDEYNWVCFEDKGSDNPDPFLREINVPISYITLAAANDAVTGDSDHGFWVRSWRPFNLGNNPNTPFAGPGTFLPPTPEKNAQLSGQFLHEGDFCPMQRVPVASIYWQKSNDPDVRHLGVSKIAMIAVLTRKIVQLLSWLDEDLLSSLALLAMPTEGGRKPKNEDGSDAVGSISVFSQLFYNKDAKHPPAYLQCHVDHLKFKSDLINNMVTEILRISHMISVSGGKQGSGAVSGERSGFHAVVNRTELIQELKDTAGNLDRFTLEIFALVKSWATGEDWDRQRVLDEIGPSVDFFKGPWTTESAADVMQEAEAAIELFREISPTAVEAALKKALRAYLYAADPATEEALKEIEENTGKFLASMDAQAVLAEAAAIAAGKQTGSTTVVEQLQPQGGDGAGAGTGGEGTSSKKPTAEAGA